MDAKIQLRKELLEGMCYVADSTYEFYYISPPLTNMHFTDSECPVPFKPGVADKFIFNKIIDTVIDKIVIELKVEDILPRGNYKMAGMQIMAKYYWPQYGEWRKMPELSDEEFYALFDR